MGGVGGLPPLGNPDGGCKNKTPPLEKQQPHYHLVQHLKWWIHIDGKPNVPVHGEKCPLPMTLNPGREKQKSLKSPNGLQMDGTQALVRKDF